MPCLAGRRMGDLGVVSSLRKKTQRQIIKAGPILSVESS